MQLPNVSGSDLNRQNRQFPTDFEGDLNLVFIAFQQWQQMHVDTWLPFAAELEEAFPGFRFYEFPTIQPMNIIARTFINEGMRAGIRDEDTRGRTITLYLDKEEFRQALDIPNENNIWIFLFDRQGQVLWRTSGPFDLIFESSLRRVVEKELLVPA